MVIYMGELIFYFIIPALSFVCATLSYLIVKWKQLDRKYMYLFPLFLIIFVFLGANDILAIISTKSKHKLMIQYFHNYVLIYRTVLPAHENALIVQKRFLPSA